MKIKNLEFYHLLRLRTAVIAILTLVVNGAGVSIALYVAIPYFADSVLISLLLTLVVIDVLIRVWNSIDQVAIVILHFNDPMELPHGILFTETENDPYDAEWSVNISKGQTQCPFMYNTSGDSWSNCHYRIGHPCAHRSYHGIGVDDQDKWVIKNADGDLH